MPKHGPDDIQNMVRLHLLFAKYGVKILKNLFLRRFELITGGKWENASKANRQTFLDRHCTSKSLNDRQRAMLQTEDVLRWDITFLASFLLNITSNDATTPAEKSKLNDENETIRRLRDLRNNVVHQGEFSVRTEMFGSIWSDAQNLFTSLGVSLEDIEHIRTTSKLDGIEFQNGDINQENMVKSTLLREEGNAAVRSNKTTEGINLYSKALLLIGLSQTERAKLYSNRSYAHMKLLQDKRNPSVDEIHEACKNALEDARLAIELQPSWWKGYNRAGNVHKFMHEFKKAIDYFEYALCLNTPVPKSVRNARDECRIDAEREKIFEHLDPLNNFTNYREIADQLYQTRGIKLGDYTIDDIQDLMNSKDKDTRARGCVSMAHRCMRGDQVPLDKQKAASLFQEAAAAGNIEGMYKLGDLHFYGEGITRDICKAVSLFEEAANQSYSDNSLNHIGIAESKYMLGRCYELGAVYDQNYAAASEWYRRASLERCGNASNNLGILYYHGLGVERNPERATQYWKLAVEQGCINASINMCSKFTRLYDIEQAEIWFQRSISAEHSFMTTKSDQFEKIFTELKQQHQASKENVLLPPDFAATGIPTPNQVKSIVETIIPEIVKIMEILGKCENIQPATTKVVSIIQKSWASYPEIYKRAEEGAIFAEKIRTAIEHCARGQYYLNGLQAWKSEISPEDKVWMKERILEDYAISYESAGFVTFLPDFLSQKFKELVQEELHIPSGQSHRNARVCHYYLLLFALDEGKKCAEIWKSKYPKEPYFYNMHANFLGFLHNFKEGVSVTTEGLDLFPNDYELLYCKAVHLRGCHVGPNFDAETMNSHVSDDVKARDKESCKLVISAYEKFIEKAPKDHRKVPESFYSMAVMSVSIGMVEKVEQYYQQGLASEKHLLSCFLPYHSPLKACIELFRKLHMMTKGFAKLRKANSESLLEDNVKDLEKHRRLKSTNPKRITVTTAHRANSLKVKRLKDLLATIQNSLELSFTMEALHVQRAPKRKAIRLKEITFDEMDPTKDHVYQNAAINLTILEDSLFNAYSSIHSVVKDDNGDFQFIYFYNLNHNDAVVRKNLSFGSRIRIKNPYFRLTAVQDVGIRVDDPKSIEYLSAGDEKSLCRFCWKENAKKKCRACGRGYCSAECLKKDRELLHHEFICNNST